MKKLFLILLSIAFLIRLLGINTVLHTDEVSWAMAVLQPFPKYINWIPHPPLAVILYKIPSILFEVTTQNLRIVPLIFGLLTIFLTYKIGQKLYNEKAAIIATILMTFSFWHNIASTQVDMDGSILTFIFLFFFFIYLKYEKKAKLTYLLYCGILLGAALLTKFTGILLLVIFALYIFFKDRNLKNTAIQVLIVALTGFGVFFIYLILTRIFAPYMLDVIFLRASIITPKFSLLSLLYLLLWATPLLLGLALIQISKLKKKDSLFIIWIFVQLIFYMFLGSPLSSPFDRYLMILIPPLAILTGNYLTQLKFDKKTFFSTLIISYFVFILINLNTTYLPHSFGNYFTYLKNFNWNFYLPFTGSSGPTMGINFITIAITMIASLFLIPSILYLKKHRNKLILIFLAINLSFNLLLIQESTLSLVYPSVSQAQYELYAYIKINEIPRPIYSNLRSPLFYLNEESTYSLYTRRGDIFLEFNYAYTTDQIISLQDIIAAEHGTFVVIDYPTLDKENNLWKLITACELKKTFFQKQTPMAYIYTC